MGSRQPRSSFHPLRGDPAALGFAVSFAFVGLKGLLEAAGASVSAQAVRAVVLLALGAAGLWQVLRLRRMS